MHSVRLPTSVDDFHRYDLSGPSDDAIQEDILPFGALRRSLYPPFGNLRRSLGQGSHSEQVITVSESVLQTVRNLLFTVTRYLF